MSLRLFHARAYRWLAALSLAAYGAFGVFGHSLHELMPCSDGSCSDWFAAEEHCCCDHAAPVACVSAETDAADGPQLSGAGHDADQCSLCVLLAKIKVGRLALFTADVRVEQSYRESATGNRLLPADLILSASPRGPPTA